MSLDASIPRFANPRELQADTLAFLRAAQPADGGLVVLSERGPMFSRARDCAGAVAVFDQAGIRQVLNDVDVFGTVVSVGELFSLPARLQRLNAGLFGMRGEQHREHQQMLRSLLGPGEIHEHGRAIAEGWNAFAASLRPGQEIPLLSEMRRLVLHVSERIIFGDAGLALGALIQSYFDCRRSLSGRRGPVAPAERRTLIDIGGRLDRMLSARLATLRHEIAAPDGAGRCLLARLTGLTDGRGERLSDDQVIAHANVLFMSSSEPVAVTLTWALLLLSQRPELRRALQLELRCACRGDDLPARLDEADLPLLKSVIQETLRLLPPSAIMVRLTTAATRVLGHALPERCEVVVSPYVAHRDQREFADPDAFDPDRWRNLKPPTYAYFPFGGGTRYCLGRQLAGFTLLSLLARILSRYDVRLAGDQELDWTINITMMPASEPVVKLLPVPPSPAAQAGGKLKGGVAALVRF
jgi:cytochrome P450